MFDNISNKYEILNQFYNISYVYDFINNFRYPHPYQHELAHLKPLQKSLNVSAPMVNISLQYQHIQEEKIVIENHSSHFVIDS